MNKKIKFIIPCIIVLIAISVSIIISISKEKVMTTNKAVSGIAIYVNNGTSYVSQSSVPTGSYYLNTALSHCVGESKINSYNNTTGVISYSFEIADKCYLYFEQGTASMQTGLASESIINLAKTGSSDLAYDDYGNVRYIGLNPNNYACLSSDGSTCINYDKDDAANKPAGLFRIIGVFNDDSHGVSGKQLVKLISADILGDTTMFFDYKQTGVGSSTSKAGSNDWSDAQLVYMLNGNVSMYNGYNGNTQLHTGYSYNSSTYYISDGTYNIYQLYNGLSYLTGNGATSLNVPASVTTSEGYTVSSYSNMQTLTTAQANMIASVTWHLGGCTSYSITSSQFYTYERGTTVYSGRPTTWIGKIGLMYLSDYGYATTGGSGYNRNTCLSTKLSYWKDFDYEEAFWESLEELMSIFDDPYGYVELYYDGDFMIFYEDYSDYFVVEPGNDFCHMYDWLVYTGSRTNTRGSSTSQWTINMSDTDDAYLFSVELYGNSCLSLPIHTSFGVRPAFYLESSVSIAGGTGTSTDPYIFTVS